MNENEYKELCVACDRLLLAPDATIERIAIPWLHVIREHPVFLRGYADLAGSEAGGINMLRQWWRRSRNTANWLRQVGRALVADGRPWSGPKGITGPIDVLFVSHLLNASQAGGSDFYFAKLPDELARQGYSVVIALINHSAKPGAELVQQWPDRAVPRVIFSNSLGFRAESVINRNLNAESARLRIAAGLESPGFTRKVAARASQEALSRGARSALRLGSQINALVAVLKPNAIVLTHEGHAWERIAFAAAREAHPGVRCMGYQHAALFRLQHAIRRNLGGRYDPEHVLTAGRLGGRLLGEAKGLKGLTTSVLGSNRGFSGKAAPRVGDKAAAGRCLVLPEGIVSECHLLFEFSIRCAEICPEIEFIWRLHPLVTFESLQAGNSRLRNLPPNVRRSMAAFESDLAGCAWALYRGTTAIVQAVGAGLRPVYLRIPGEMTIDLLYELEGWKASVETPDDFKKLAVLEVATLQNGFHPPGEELVRDYCQGMFEPFKPEELARLIGPASS